MRIRENLSGKILNDRLIIECVESKKNIHSKYKVKCLNCNCNNIYITTKSNILHTKNCHKCCSRNIIGPNNPKWKGGEIIPMDYFNSIKRNAKTRNLKFNISINYLEKLYNKQNKKCFFVDEPLSFIDKTASLDRINSSKGYVKNNVQWVHKDINLMKNNKNDSGFINSCIKIHFNTHESKKVGLPPKYINITHKNFKGIGYITKNYYTSIRRGAFLRNINFSVSMEDMNKQFLWQSGKCNLTGEDLYFSTRSKKGISSLDRIDNHRGYTTDNIQWVHKDINMLKFKMSQERLLDICKKITKKFTINVAISGYFQILHAGHIDYIRNAKKLGGYLIAIINSDQQAKLKSTPSVINEKNRAYIVSNIKGVDEVVISIDSDRSVSKTLEKINPHIFCNGGDRTENNSSLKEKETCNRLGIKIIYTGGSKVDSSSDILKRTFDVLSKNYNKLKL